MTPNVGRIPALAVAVAVMGVTLAGCLGGPDSGDPRHSGPPPLQWILEVPKNASCPGMIWIRLWNIHNESLEVNASAFKVTGAPNTRAPYNESASMNLGPAAFPPHQTLEPGASVEGWLVFDAAGLDPPYRWSFELGSSGTGNRLPEAPPDAPACDKGSLPAVTLSDGAWDGLTWTAQVAGESPPYLSVDELTFDVEVTYQAVYFFGFPGTQTRTDNVTLTVAYLDASGDGWVSPDDSISVSVGSTEQLGFLSNATFVVMWGRQYAGETALT